MVSVKLLYISVLQSPIYKMAVNNSSKYSQSYQIVCAKKPTKTRRWWSFQVSVIQLLGSLPTFGQEGNGWSLKKICLTEKVRYSHGELRVTCGCVLGYLYCVCCLGTEVGNIQTMFLSSVLSTFGNFSNCWPLPTVQIIVHLAHSSCLIFFPDFFKWW